MSRTSVIECGASGSLSPRGRLPRERALGGDRDVRSGDARAHEVRAAHLDRPQRPRLVPAGEVGHILARSAPFVPVAASGSPSVIGASTGP